MRKNNWWGKIQHRFVYSNYKSKYLTPQPNHNGGDLNNLQKVWNLKAGGAYGISEEFLKYVFDDICPMLYIQRLSIWYVSPTLYIQRLSI